MRTLVVGDIHGNAKGLEQVLSLCKFDYNKDKLISLGDVADGWNETSECVDILLDVKKRSVRKPIFIRGNHDVWVYDWMMFGQTPTMWTTQGGKATLDSYVRTQKLVDKDHKNFWFTQKDWYIDTKGRLFIHAGWAYADGRISWGHLSPRDLFKRQASMSVNAGSIARECHWDRDLLYGAKSGAVREKATGKPSGFRALETFKEVYIGHTATKSHNVENYLNLWNMDSGSGWYGRLAIMDINSKEIWYSDRSMDLYPDEKGRG